MAKPKGRIHDGKEALEKGSFRPTAEENGQYFGDNGQ